MKRRSDGNLFLKCANEHFFVSGLVIKGLIIWGSKCHQNNSPVVCDGYVTYEGAEADRLVTAAANRVEYSKQPASARAA